MAATIFIRPLTFTCVTARVSPGETLGVTMPTCRVTGCENGQARQGVCWAHYRRFRLYGHPLGHPKKVDHRTRVIARVERNTVRTDVGCWVYDTATPHRPRINVDGHRIYVSNLIYSQYVRPLERHERLVPLCPTSNCVNPAHHEVRNLRTQAA